MRGSAEPSAEKARPYWQVWLTRIGCTYRNILPITQIVDLNHTDAVQDLQIVLMRNCVYVVEIIRSD